MLLTKLTPKVLNQFRRGYLVPLRGPPNVKISTAQYVGLLSTIAVGITAVPIWVIFHIPDYNGRRKQKLEVE
ncbi:hypothetical protein GJ496_002152 [Pomphorhynchus laevis]|nr:hypothetical protein GJ496_002152 [Pomphorhynchus laevis]